MIAVITLVSRATLITNNTAHFAYDHLLDHAHTSNLPLFSDLGKDIFVPTPVGDFPPCHYLKVPDAEGSHERP